LYEEAEDYYYRGLSLAPDRADFYNYKAQNRIYKTGTTEDAREILNSALKRKTSITSVMSEILHIHCDSILHGNENSYIGEDFSGKDS
jgi:hypothetical protein